MLVLSTLHQLLSQVLFRPHLHTAVLLTPSGELVSFACSFERPKDEVRVLVGLSGEIWRETRHHGFGMVDSEVQIQCIPVAQTYNPKTVGTDCRRPCRRDFGRARFAGAQSDE